MNKPKLKPCPFCGDKAVWEKNNNLIGNILVTALLKKVGDYYEENKC